MSLISEQLALGSLDRTGAVDQTYSGHANGAVYGILTPLEDMPLSGTLQSQTGATAAIQDDTSQYALYDGTVNVTFSNSKVSATLSDFRGTGQTSGGASNSYEKGELDLSIHLTNAALSGACGQSQFCGGSVSLSGNAAQNKTPSSNATVDAKGTFLAPKQMKLVASFSWRMQADYLFKPVSWASRMTRPCLSPTVASDRDCFYCAFHHTSGINPIRSP